MSSCSTQWALCKCSLLIRKRLSKMVNVWQQCYSVRFISASSDSLYTAVDAIINAKNFCRNSDTMLLAISRWEIFLTRIGMSRADLISPGFLQEYPISGPSKHNNWSHYIPQTEFSLEEECVYMWRNWKIRDYQRQLLKMLLLLWLSWMLAKFSSSCH